MEERKDEVNDEQWRDEREGRKKERIKMSDFFLRMKIL